MRIISLPADGVQVLVAEVDKNRQFYRVVRATTSRRTCVVTAFGMKVEEFMAKRQAVFPGFEEPVRAVAEKKRSAGRSTNQAAPAGPSPSAPPTPLAGPKRLDAMLPEELAGKRVYVVDAHGLIYQVFHAMPDMTGPSGQPVGAIHGFTRDMLDLVEKHQPDLIFCAYDHSEVTFRNEIYPGYKQSRDAMPEDLQQQISHIHRMISAIGIGQLTLPGFEADDILATVARLVSEAGGECVLVTNDKDCRQLINPNVRIYSIRKDQYLAETELEEDWGIRPDQVVDFQSLVGDSVDDVPGVPLIGPKIAKELLQRFDTLENVLDNAEQVSGKKRKANLIEFRDQALMSRELVRLDNDAPVDIAWEEGTLGGVELAVVDDLCTEFGFRRLGERIAALTTPPVELVWEADYRTVGDLAQLTSIAVELSERPQFAIGTETTHTNPRWASLVGITLSWQAQIAYYIPLRAPASDVCLEWVEVAKILGPVLSNPKIEKIGQNLKSDVIVFKTHGIQVQGACFDTMVADYLLSPGERNHDTDDLSRRYLHHATVKAKDLTGTGRQQRGMHEVPVELVTAYAGEDADVPMRLAPILRGKLESAGLLNLFDELEMPLVGVLAEMEYLGICVDSDHLRDMGDRFAMRLDQLEEEIYDLAEGERFNIDSPRQLAKILFEKLQLPVIKQTRKTGPSTDADVLQELAGRHELPARLLEYRQFAKLKSTYVDALQVLIHPETGRVHTSFKQDVAATGRLSSNNPNLQNIPVRTAEGREIREAFRAGVPGWKLLAADYSQIELRVLAHFCGDSALLEAFEQDQDIHARVACEVYEVPLEEVDSEMRRRAKAVNFGVIYGQTPFGLAKALGIDKDEAAQFIDAYFQRYDAVDRFMAESLEECRQTGYASTILGRQRPVEGVRHPSRRTDLRFRTLAERIAINTVIQGSAADLIKMAMLRVDRRLKNERLQSRMLLQIHDELLFEGPEEELEPLAKLVREEMMAAADLKVVLKVDVASGDNWGQCK
jgi:DNA polymerase I